MSFDLPKAQSVLHKVSSGLAVVSGLVLGASQLLAAGPLPVGPAGWIVFAAALVGLVGHGKDLGK